MSTLNVMTVDDYCATIDGDQKFDFFKEKILGLTSGADVYIKNPKELRADFKRSLRTFLEVCAGKGIEPKRHFSGKFELQILPQLHERLAVATLAKDKRTNTLAQEALQEGFASIQYRLLCRAQVFQ